MTHSGSRGAKLPSASRTTMTQLIFPEHANALGKAFGGQVMAWADMCGGICSMRHTGGLTVTASVDELHFENSIAIGDVAVIEAQVNATFSRSMEVEVSVAGENPRTGARWQCVSSRMTFVAIDADGKPCSVAPLQLDSDDDAARAAAATRRRAERLSRRRSVAGT